MPAPNTWICRGCWKPNRLRDARCFMCKLPRDADAAQIQHQAAVNQARTAPPDLPDIVLNVPVIIFRWYARGLLLIAVLLFVILVGEATSGAPDAHVIQGALVMGACLGAGILFRALAGAMQDGNPWVYMTALVAAGAMTALAAVQLFVLPVPLGTGIDPRAATVRTWITLVISGSAAICAGVGLAISVSRARAD
jgi:hypothetical protein